MTALHVLTTLPKQGGKRPPGAIVLLSDGGANTGWSPAASARQAKADHIPIYTIALGTAHGTIPVKQGAGTSNARRAGERPAAARHRPAVRRALLHRRRTRPVPSAVYAHLATKLGHKHVKREITASFAGGGLVLLLLGSVLSLAWFGRLA